MSLLDRPHDPDFETGAGFRVTALHLAVHNGRECVVRCLVEAGADMNKVTDQGKKAMHLAIPYDHKEVVRLLVEAGADKDKGRH